MRFCAMQTECIFPDSAWSDNIGKSNANGKCRKKYGTYGGAGVQIGSRLYGTLELYLACVRGVVVK